MSVQAIRTALRSGTKTCDGLLSRLDNHSEGVSDASTTLKITLEQLRSLLKALDDVLASNDRSADRFTFDAVVRLQELSTVLQQLSAGGNATLSHRAPVQQGRPSSLASRLWQRVSVKRRSLRLTSVSDAQLGTTTRTIRTTAAECRDKAELAYKELKLPSFSERSSSPATSCNAAINQEGVSPSTRARLANPDISHEGVPFAEASIRSISQASGLEAGIAINSRPHATLDTTTSAAQERPQTLRQILKPARVWLDPPDYSFDHTNGQAYRSHIRTGQWLLDDEQYRSWRDGAQRSNLWIHGKSGTSKTTLCSTIVEDVRQHAATRRTAVAYFYVTYRQSSDKVYEALLRSIAIQLAEHAAARQVLIRAYDHASTDRAPASELESLVIMQLQCLKDVHLIVDAIDECSHTIQRRELMRGLARLSSLGSVRTLTTSRPEADIERSMLANHYTSYAIPLDRINADIGIWLEAQLEAEDKFSLECKSLISRGILSNADGMFLWAISVFGQLNQTSNPTKAKVLADLDSIPKDMHATYERMLSGISSADTREAITALQWLAYSQVLLTVEQLAEAVWLSNSTTRLLSYDEKPDPYNIWSMLSQLTIVNHVQGHGEELTTTRLNILEAKRLDIPPWQLKIQLLHPSVRDFLMSSELQESSLASYHLIEGVVHHQIAQRCLAYLLQLEELFKTRTVAAEEDLPDNPLELYAAEYSIVHQRKAEQFYQLQNSPSLPADDYMLRFLKDPKMNFYNRGYEPIYAASIAGLNLTLKTIDPRRIDKINTSESAGTALIAAVQQGFDDTVEVLLDLGADPDTIAGYFGSALCTAAQFGHSSIVKRLLNYGVQINALAYGSRKNSPLMCACSSNSFDIVKSLVMACADVNLARPDGRTALHIACSVGNDDMVQYLLDSGAAVDAYSQEWSTPLFLAVLRGHTRCQQSLMERGASLKTVHPEDGSILHCAIEAYRLREDSGTQNDEALEMLVEAGMDIDSLNGWTVPPIIHAIRTRQIRPVAFLLGRGVTLSVKDEDGRNVVAVAQETGKPEIVDLVTAAAVSQIAKL